MKRAFAWGGGAAFVVSLAYFAYTYAVTLGRPGDVQGGPVGSAATIDTLLFAAFAVHHSVFARARTKRWFTRLVPASIERSVFVWAASLLLTLVCAAWHPLPGSVYRHTGLLGALHLIPVALGVLLTAFAARLLDPLDLAGIDQATGRSRPKPEGEDLVTRFPYNVVRHPIYLGWALFVFGVAHMTWGRLLLASLSTLYLVVAIPWEERLLIKTFGTAYRAYQRRVRWRMIPFVY